MSKQTTQRREEAKQFLLEGLGLQPGQTIYTKLDKVSSSGMSRNISVFVVSGGRIVNISYRVAAVLGWTFTKDENVRVSGCGMDMGFHLVYSLGCALFSEGFKLAPNQHGRNGDTSGFDKDGGYALRAEWL